MSYDTAKECENLIAQNPELFEENPNVDKISILKEEEWHIVSLRSKISHLTNELCSSHEDHALLIYKMSTAIRTLDASVGEDIICAENKVLFSVPCDRDMKLKGRDVKLNHAIAMETKYHEGISSDSQHADLKIGNSPIKYSELRKIYKVLHLVFSQSNGKSNSKIDQHFGWIFLNLSLNALENMDEGHVMGRIWNGNEIDAAIRIKAQKQGINMENSGSATLIWNANNARDFSSAPEFSDDFSEAVLITELHKFEEYIKLISHKRSHLVSSLNHHSRKG